MCKDLVQRTLSVLAARKVVTKEVLTYVGQLLQRITLAELGLTAMVEPGQFPSAICHLTLCKAPEMELTVFFVPRGQAFPLHDHPSMHVVSRVVYGKLHLQSFDWMGGQGGGAGRKRERYATQSFDGQVDVSTGIISAGPEQGNVHSLTALTDTIFVDALLPPYCDEDGRSCRFYRAQPLYTHSPSDQALSLLQQQQDRSTSRSPSSSVCDAELKDDDDCGMQMCTSEEEKDSSPPQQRHHHHQRLSLNQQQRKEQEHQEQQRQGQGQGQGQRSSKAFLMVEVPDPSDFLTEEMVFDDFPVSTPTTTASPSSTDFGEVSQRLL